MQGENTASSKRSVLVLGEAGSGKSCIINMIAERVMAATGDGHYGTTVESAQYEIKIDEEKINGWKLDDHFRKYRDIILTFYDTAGLFESVNGSVPAEKAYKGVFKAMVEAAESIHLIILVMRKGKAFLDMREQLAKLVDLCKANNFPVLLVVTHCEGNLEWTEQNKDSIQKFYTTTAISICAIASIGGGIIPLDVVYTPSKKKLLSAILTEVHLDGEKKFQGMMEGIFKLFLEIWRGTDYEILYKSIRGWLRDSPYYSNSDDKINAAIKDIFPERILKLLDENRQ